MTVRKFMALWTDNVKMKVYQIPIKEIDKCKEPVLRQAGSVNFLINSNQNYLDFEIRNLQSDNGIIVIVCEANDEQRRSTINAYKYGR